MSTLSHAASSAEKRTNARCWIVVMLFIVTSTNYGDRATLSIAGSGNGKDIGSDPVGMGYVFLRIFMGLCCGQIGWLAARSFWIKRVYFWSIFIWSMFTLLQASSISSAASVSSRSLLSATVGGCRSAILQVCKPHRGLVPGAGERGTAMAILTLPSISRR